MLHLDNEHLLEAALTAGIGIYVLEDLRTMSNLDQ